MSAMTLENVIQEWTGYTDAEKITTFTSLDRDRADELFLSLRSSDQKLILDNTTDINRRTWVRSLEPDDLVDLVQSYEAEDRKKILSYLDSKTRSEANALLAYNEDVAGGLMNTRFIRLRDDMSVAEALQYLRAQTISNVETVYYAYVFNGKQQLVGVISLRQIIGAGPKATIRELMTPKEDIVKIPEGMSKEEIARIFSQYSYLAIPVVDSQDHMVGILTVDDVVDMVQNVATEDIQKFGGQEALDAPYFQIGFLSMVKKRAGWLLALFIGEMFTATAMGYYEQEIEKAVVLALFIPLIISSGGNSGSQASTLIIRAMALGEVRIKDWWKVFVRELSSGLSLGLVLGSVGLMRIVFWPTRVSTYGEHYILIALAVGCSLIGIVTWGTLAGSMLPFALRKFKLDPATASAPFVATLVDVTGLIIYFTIASLFLKGTLL